MPRECLDLRVHATHSAAWHEARRLGIGSSDAPAVCGMDRWGTPYSVWASKVMDVPPDGDGGNDAMRWGTRLEAAVADEYADQHPDHRVVVAPAMYAHDKYDYLRASPDRLLYTPDGELGLLEIKTSQLADEWAGDAPPDRTVIQVHHQMMVMDCRWAVVAVLLFGRTYREFVVDRDDALVAALLRIEHAFWQRVVAGDPPPVDGNDATLRALREMYPGEADRTVQLPADALELRAQLAAARKAVADAERARDELEAQVRVLLGDAEYGAVDDVHVFRWSVGSQKRLDVDRLRADHPDLAEAYTKAVPQRRLTLPKIKEQQ